MMPMISLFLRSAKDRKLSLVNSREWADGKIFTGRQAKKLGLIDEVGSLENAIRSHQEKSHV